MTRTEIALLMLKSILGDLPKVRDWLDPEIEHISRELVAGREPKVVWEPLEPAHFDEDPERNAQFLKALGADYVVQNNVYQVYVRYCWPRDLDTGELIHDESRRMLHLSIKRLDKEVLHDWRDIQRIKNEVAGPEFEAVEIYPAESRLADSANQYHIWVYPPGQQVPFGLGPDRIILESNAFVGSSNRPFDEPALKQEAAETLERLKQGKIPGGEMVDNIRALKSQQKVN